MERDTIARTRVYGRQSPSLDGATAWLNSDPLTPDSLRGKVVLVQFWTYSCIEWLWTFPYIRAWAEKHKSKVLVVSGVHTPEYSFEHDVDNVRRAAHGIGVQYPVAIDNHHAIWDAFKNQYSPALYLVDAKGGIRHQLRRANRVFRKLPHWCQPSPHDVVELGLHRMQIIALQTHPIVVTDQGFRATRTAADTFRSATGACRSM